MTWQVELVNYRLFFVIAHLESSDIIRCYTEQAIAITSIRNSCCLCEVNIGKKR